MIAPSFDHPSVAFFPSAFHPSLGGIEELTRQLVLEQQRRGAASAVFAMRWPKDLPRDETVGGIAVHREVFRTPELRPRHLAGWAVHGRRTVNNLSDLVREGSFGVIHVQGVSGNAYYALRVARALRLPLVVSLQGELTMDANHIYEKSHVLPGLLRVLFNEAAAITACSRQTLDEAIEFTAIDPGRRASVVYNGVNLSDFDVATSEAADPPFILAIGRHVREKGFDVLIRAFAHAVRSSGIRHDLVIAGDGACSGELKDLAKSLGLESRVHFPGRCNREQTMQLFDRCSFFVLPSRHEPMGIVNLEAMASGKAVIATRVGGVPEFVRDNVNGLLVPPADAEALSGAIVTIAADSLLRTRLSEAGKHAVRGFDWSSVADKYAHVYRRVLLPD